MPDSNIALLPQALCLVSDVKELVQPNLPADFDSTITTLINAFTAYAENALTRKFLKTTYTEYFNGGTKCIHLKAPPINDFDQLYLHVDTKRLWTDDTLYTIWDDYDPGNGQYGMIKVHGRYAFPHGTRIVKVDYPGGLVVNDDINGTFECPDDLRSACAMQVSFWWKHRTDLGISNLNFGGGAISVFQPTKILPMVNSILLNYRRFEI